MDCKEINELLSGYADRELDLVRSLKVEEHLKSCVPCFQKYDAGQTLSKVIKENDLYHKAPSAVQDRVRAAIRSEQRKQSRPAYFRWQPLAYVASLMFVFLIGWMVGHPRFRLSADAALRQEILTSHIRSMMPGHLTDVLSSDQHTVKPWFNGKLDFSPPVNDFSAQGFPLLGGRLDYVNNRSVVVLVYGRRKHVINVYLWPSSDSERREAKTVSMRGYHIMEWTASGMNCYAVSDLNQSELSEFVSLLRSQPSK